MSVLSAKEDFQARESGTKLSEKKATTTHKRRWIVQTTTVTDSGAIALSAAGLPKPYDKHPDDSSCFAIEISAKPRAGHPTVWDVVVTYSSDQPNQDPGKPGDPSKDPTLLPTRYALSYTTITRALDRDYFKEDANGNPIGDPIVNSVGEYFDPPLESDQYLPVIIVEKNCDFFASTLSDWSGAINENQLIINGRPFKPYTALCKIRQTPFFQNNVPYWTTNYEFTINKGTWLRTPIDRGTRKRVPGPNGSLYESGATFVRLADAFGQPFNTPQFLDGTGKPLATNLPPVYLDGTHNNPGLKTDNGPFYMFPVRTFSPL